MDAVGNTAAPVSAGVASRLDDVAFTAPARTYEEDIPTRFRQGASTNTQKAITSGTGSGLVLASSVPQVVSPRSDAETRAVEAAVIASGVRQLSKMRRSAGRVVQRRIGWQATPERIIVTTAEREMTQREPGKYAPAGPWLIEDRRTFSMTAGAKAAKRVGKVAVDPSSTSSTPQGTPTPGDTEAGEHETRIAASFPEGARAMGVLPAAVRRSMIARVPDPTHFDGIILQWTDSTTDEPQSVRVDVLRMDKHRAVVIRADRAWSGEAWDVSQADYQLADLQIEAA